MATWGAFEVDIYDRSLTLQGTITTATDGRGEEELNGIGGGNFRFPADDTAAKNLIQKYRMAVGRHTNNVIGRDVIVFCFEILDVRLEEGEPNILYVGGPGRLHELQYDNLAYNLISDGSGGATSSWYLDILAYASESWNSDLVGLTGTEPAYLQASGETVWDALVQLMTQAGQPLTYTLSRAPARRIAVIRENISGDPVLAFDDLDLIQPVNPAAYESSSQYAIIRGKPRLIEETSEVVTRVYAYGGGLGTGRFTIQDASGAVSLPTGFSADYANSVVINNDLEAESGQPPITRVEQWGHIKPETNDPTDPLYSTSHQTAAVQLVNAALEYLQERTGDTRIYYEIEAMCHGDYMPGQLVNLNYSDDEFTINDDFVLHKIEHRVERGERVSTLLVGEPTYRRTPKYAQVIAKKIKQIEETMRHAEALNNPAAPGTGGSIADASFLLVADFAGMPNRRIAADGLGTVFNDGGTGGDSAWDISLSAEADAIFVASSGLLDLDTQAAGTFLAGPAAGAAAKPSFRQIDFADLPAGITDAGYIVQALSGDLPFERLATAGDGIDIVDDGFGGGNITWSVDVTDIIDTSFGLTESSNNIRIDLASPSGLSFSGGDLQLDDSVAGAGLTISSKVLAVGAGDGIDVAADSVAVDVTDLLGDGITEASNNITLGTPSTLTVSSSNGVTASSHTHAITTSSDVTGASILASDSNGRLGLEGLGIGTAQDGDYIKVASGGIIGLGNSTAGRFEFTNAATDLIELHDGDLHLVDGGVTKLEIRHHGDVDNTGADLHATNDFAASADENCYMLIDADNNETDRFFAVLKNDTTFLGATEIFRIDESDTATIRSSTAAPIYRLEDDSDGDWFRTRFSRASDRLTIDSNTTNGIISLTKGGNVLIGANNDATEQLEVALATENLEIVDAGSTGATEQDWIEVQVGGVTGYIRVYASK